MWGLTKKSTSKLLSPLCTFTGLKTMTERGTMRGLSQRAVTGVFQSLAKPSQPLGQPDASQNQTLASNFPLRGLPIKIRHMGSANYNHNV